MSNQPDASAANPLMNSALSADVPAHHHGDWWLLLVPGVIWGASFLFIAEGLQAMAPDGVTFTRFVFGFLTLSLIPGARRPVVPADRVGIAGLGVLWLALPMSMFPHAEQHVSSALTGMLNGAVPLIATAVAAMIARSAPAGAVLAGLMVGLSGAIIMALPGLGAGGNSTRGVLMILGALVCYGTAINLARPLQQRNGALPVVWRALGVALVITAPLGLPALLAARWTARSFLAVLALGCLGTAIANVAMAMAAGRFGATRASVSGFLIPVVALLLGVAVRGEQVPALSLAGGALCLLGAWMVRRGTMAR